MLGAIDTGLHLLRRTGAPLERANIMTKKYRDRALTDNERFHRGVLLSEAYLPYLRERHPMGSVVAINLATAEYVVGPQSPQAMHLYWDKFGKEADADMYLEPIHWPNTRPMEDEIAEVNEWVRQRKQSSRRKPDKWRFERLPFWVHPAKGVLATASVRLTYF